MKKLCSIYCFTNLITNKKYIGSTIQDPKVRYNQHIYNAKNENAHQHNYPLYQAMRKYGLDNFTFEILYQDMHTEEEIRDIEADFIKTYNTVSPYGYNQTENTQHPLNDAISYEKMSNTKRENGKEVVEVDENKQILSIWRSLTDCAEDTQIPIRQIGAVCRGEQKTVQNRYFYYIDENMNILFPETTKFIYKGEKGTTQIQSTSKKVAKCDIHTEKILAVYDTIALASRENNCDSSGISKVCRGKRNACGGFKWKYIE